MIRCTIPAITVVLSYLVLGQKTPFRTILSLIPVIVGACIVYAGEVLDSQFLFIARFGSLLLVSLSPSEAASSPPSRPRSKGTVPSPLEPCQFPRSLP